jgi:hypothetical protein
MKSKCDLKQHQQATSNKQQKEKKRKREKAFCSL